VEEEETRAAEMVIIQPNQTRRILYLFSCGGGGDQSSRKGYLST